MDKRKKTASKFTLGPAAGRALKFLHVVFVSSVLGCLLAMTVLLALKSGMRSDDSLFYFDLAVFRIFDGPVTWGFFCMMVSSFVISFFTEWGFIKYWWIIVKWAVLVLLFAAAWFVLGPSVSGMVSLSDAGYSLTTAKAQYASNTATALVFSALFDVAFLFLMFVSVFKPWGQTKFKIAVNKTAVLWTVIVFAAVGLFFGVVGTISMARYRNVKITDTDVKKLRDGRYTGEAEVAGYTYKTEVIVKNRQIVSVRAIENRKSPYAYLAEGVFRKVLKYQNANVDAVTGATTTSKALLKSVENALVKAK